MARRKYKGTGRMNALDKTAAWLIVIGGINWGLAVFDFNLVQWIAEAINFEGLAKIIYTLVGVSSVWLAIRALRKFR